MQLQLENGETKNYVTWYSHSESEYDTSTYKTKCGLSWNKEPNFDVGCDHFDCALMAIDRKIGLDAFASGMCLFSGIISVLVMNEAPPLLGLGVIYILAGIFFILKWYNERRIKQELTEFREHETIKGIKAWKI